MFKSSRYFVLFTLFALAGHASAQGMVCDVDLDGDVDKVDIGLIVAARNTPASGPDDPRDFNRDGFITVVDARGCLFRCTLPGCEEPAGNTPPVADAGADQTVTVGDTVTLDGSGSSDADGDPLTFMWDLDVTPAGSTAALSDPTAIMPDFTADAGGTYIAELIVNDGTDDSAPDETVVVTAPGNTAPVADAGPDQTALVGDTVTLDGSGSFDVDGDPLTFAWNLAQRPAGSAAALSDPTAVMPTFVIDTPGTYVVELVVDDGLAGSFPDSVTITTLNSPPVADAGPDQTVNLFDTVFLDGTGSFDPDGDTLTYAWDFTSTPPDSLVDFDDPTSPTPTFFIDAIGDFAVQLIVNDGTVDSDPDTILIVTSNTRPVSVPGPDQTAQQGDTVQLDGSASFDDDGNALTFDWSFTTVPAGSAAALSDPTAVAPTFVADEPGIYVIQLIVNDGILDSFPETTMVTVEVAPNNAPVLDPIGNQTVDEETPLTFVASANDPDAGDALTFSLDAGAPAGATIDPQTGIFSWVPDEGDGPGTFPITVRVTDDGTPSLDDSETIIIGVDEVNLAPVLAPIGDRTVQTETPLTIAAVASDPDIPANALAFSLDVGAPAGASIDPLTGLFLWTPNAAQGTGDFTLTVRVTDDGTPSLDDSETITITVTEEPNTEPAVDAGPDAAVDEGDTFTSGGSFTDPDADTWTATVDYGAGAGLQTLLLNPDNTFTLNNVYADDGTFVVTVTVTDDAGGVGSDTAVVTVNNVAPVVDAGPDQTIDAGDAFLSAGSFTDPGADTWTATVDYGEGAGPQPLAPDANNTFVLDNVYEDAGTYTVTVTVTDDDGGVGSDTATVTVNAANSAPVIAAIGNQTVDEETTLSLTAVATDPDLGDTLTFSLGTGAPAGAVIDPDTGLFTWTPAEADGPGTFPVTVIVTDDGTPALDDIETFIIGVDEVNVAPQIAPIGTQTVDEETELTVTVTANDADLPANALTFSLGTGAPAGAAIDPDTGLFTWTPAEAEGPGTFPVTVIVTDDGTPALDDIETFIIGVDEVNVAPVLEPIGNRAIEQEQELTFTATASDADLPANALTFSLDAGAPAGATIDPATGLFSWTPTAAQGPDDFTVTVRVTDDGTPTLDDSETITITVSEVPNNAPVLTPIGDQTVDENTELSFTATATDDDVGDTLTFSLDLGAPAGAAIDPATGLFSWTPDESQGPDTFTVTLRVTDDGTPTLDDSDTFTITVNEINDAPQIDPIGAQTVDEETELTVTVTANDADLPANALTFSLGTGAPAGAAIDPDTGLFTWTPEEADGPGTFPVTVIVTDDGTPALDDIETFIIGVDEVNQAPVLAPIGDQSVDELTELTFTAAGTDDDIPANALTFSLDSGAPAGATIDPATGDFSWTPAEADGGTDFTVTVRVTDDGTPVLDDSETITITVNEVNAAPTADAGPDQAAISTDVVQLDGSGSSDPDGDPLTFAWSVSSGPAGSAVNFSDATAESPTATFSDPGTYVLQLIVSDASQASDPDTVTIVVDPAPSIEIDDPAPVLEGDSGTTPVTFSVTLSAPLNREVSVNFATANSTATAGDDYLAASGSVVFPANSTAPQTITVDIIGDTDVEPNEFFFVNLANPVNATIAHGQGVGTIQNDDATATLSLTPATLNLATGDVGGLLLTLSSPAGPGGQVVDLSSSDTSVATVAASVTILEGNTQLAFNVNAGNAAGSATITATAAGFASDSSVVNVASRTLSIALEGPLVGIGRSIGGTVTLAQPAGAGGVTVTLVSAETAIATIAPAQITIPAGQTTGTFDVTGVAVGDTVLTAAAPGFDPDAVNVTVTSNLINFGVVPDTAPGQSVGLPVSISSPAAGDLTINFVSSDTSIATVTPSIVIPNGAQIPAVNPQVTGVNLGTVAITGTAVGFAPDMQDINVTIVLNFTPTTFSVVETTTDSITLGLSAPAPVGGLTVPLATGDPSIATVPTDITIPAGQTTGQVPVTGEAQGSTTLSTNVPGATQAAATVNVTPAPSISIVNDTIGSDLQTSRSATLGAPAPAGGITVTLTSNDPARLLLADNPALAGGTTVTRFVNAGSTFVSSFTVQALDDTGSATYTASAPGYASTDVTVTFQPSGFDINSPSAIDTNTEAANTNVQVCAWRLNPTTLGRLSSQNVRGGLTANVPVTSSDTNVGVITTSPLPIGPNDNCENTQFDPLSAGSSTISVSQPAGFAIPNARQSIVANVSAPEVQLPNNTVFVGEDLQTNVNIFLETPPPGPVNVTVTVDQPGLAIVSNDANVVGGASTTFVGVTNTSVGTLYVQGLSQGAPVVTASAPGYASDTMQVEVRPSGFDINSPSAINTTTLSTNTNVQVCAWRLNPATLNREQSQSVRAGLTAEVPVMSSDTNVGIITPNPLPVGPNDNCENAQFDPLNAGTSTVSISQPAGFDTPAARQSITATVTAPDVVMAAQTIVGENLQTNIGLSLQNPAPAPVDVTVTIDDPNTAIISDNPAIAGGNQIVFPAVSGTFVGTFYVQGLVSGTAIVTASAPGFDTATMNVTIDPSGFDINSPASFSTNTFATNTNIQICAWRLNPATLARLASQNVRGGLTVNVPVTSSDTNVGVITASPVPIGPNDNCENTQFDPISIGVTTIAVQQPAGFDTPSARQSIVATVDAPDINLGTPIRVGSDLQVGRSVFLESAPPGPVDVTISSSDPGAVTVSDDPTTAGGGSVTFFGVTSTTVGNVYIQGRNIAGTVVTAQAAGYNDDSITVDVDPSGFDINSPASITTSAGAINTNIQICAWRLDATFLNRQQTQNVRGGLTVSVPVLSSDTNVGTITTSPLPIGPNINCQNTQFDPMNPGTTTISITAPGGFETPSQRQSIIATVTP